VDKTLICQSR